MPGIGQNQAVLKLFDSWCFCFLNAAAVAAAGGDPQLANTNAHLAVNLLLGPGQEVESFA